MEEEEQSSNDDLSLQVLDDMEVLDSTAGKHHHSNNIISIWW
jgi:hypothetical protein